MATKDQEERRRWADEELREKLPPGVKLLRTLEGHKGGVFSLAFDPQGKTLGSGGDDKTVKLWEPLSGKLLRTFKGHQGRVWSVAFDPQGETMASGSEDGSSRLWEVPGRRLLRTLERNHIDEVYSVAFDPQGRTLASGSRDNTVKVWEAQSGKLLSFPPLMRGRVYADFRDELWYFTTAFDLILSLYQLPPNHSAVADLRESLRGPDTRFR